MNPPMDAPPRFVIDRIPSEAVPYRKSFLRWHVPQVLGDLREVLAVKVLAERAGRPLGSDDRFWLLDQFFDTDEPPGRLWIPVSLEREGGPAREDRQAETLSDLLAAMEGRSNFGVLLRARTGAGKTLAAFKAFRDCFLPVPDLDALPGADRRPPRKPPPLRGRLPLWLPVTASVPVKAEMRQALADGVDLEVVAEEKAPRLLGELILHAARLDPALWKRVETWIKHGPPLLLFADLNAADDLTRRGLAHALGQWQASLGAGKSHRIVVTYRSAVDDVVMNTLRRLAPMELRDLAPVNRVQAQNYLLGHRDLERRFFEERLRLRRAPEARSVAPEVEADLLGSLVEHHGNDPHSLISTPLLMHFATTLKGGLTDVHTITDLYDRVIDESIDRDLVPPGDAPARVWPGPLADPEQGREVTKVVMTRVALAILAADPDATRLTPRSASGRLIDAFGDLVAEPASQPRGARWAHPDPFWARGPYQSEPYQVSTNRPRQKAFLDALLELGLFRREGESLGFLHDSLVYHFAGKLALRDHLGPGRPSRDHELHPDWALKVAERMRDDPPAWEPAGRFLGAALQPGELRDLAARMLAVTPAEGTTGLAPVLHQVLRGRPRPGANAGANPLEPVFAELERVTWRGEGRRHPEALAGMALEWLRDAGLVTGVGGSFLDDVAAALTRGERPWSSANPPVPRPTGVWHRPHSAVTALVALRDGRIVSGGAEGSVVLWEPETGRSRVIHRHEGAVRCLARRRGGGVASGGDDGVVAIWSGGMTALALHQHDGWVNCLAGLRGGGVASGGLDGTVAVWSGGRNAHVVHRHDHWVRCLAELSGGGVASGGDDGTVAVWRGGTHARVVHQHDDGVRCLKGLRGGGFASGGEDGTVAVWSGGTDARVVHQHDDEVRCLVGLRGGGLASGGLDGAVAVWRGGTTARVVHQHHDEVRCLAGLWGGGLASGGRDGTVAVWRGGTTARVVHQHHERVNCLVGLRDGGLASGGRDGAVAVWTGETAAHVVHQHDGWVSCLTSLRGGGLASGGTDGEVAVWHGGTTSLAVHQHDGHFGVRCLAGLWGGGLASGGLDGAVVVWRGGTHTHVVHQHDRWVNCLAGLRGGGLASGGDDGVVAVWTPGWRRPALVITYEGVEDLLWIPIWDEHGGRLAVQTFRGPLLLVRVHGLESGRVTRAPTLP